jgi:UDP-N-acetylglucosamine diphosphorylase/glucosamine-1-phosphate N-acetyltransferase
MINIILFDDESWDSLLPLTFTRPVCELRIGILTIREKWEMCLQGKASFITQEYLSERFPIRIEQDNFVVNGSVLPEEPLISAILGLEPNEALLKDGDLIAARLNAQQFSRLMDNEGIDELKGFELEELSLIKIHSPWDLFSFNAKALDLDFESLTAGRASQAVSHTNQVFGRENIFIEEGAKVEGAVLNATTGPIYIGKDAVVMEGSLIRGGLALCQGAQLKMGAKIYGATTIGPWSKVGGEVNNSVFLGYGNKAHDGFLGNSVIGQWCNLGADTNNSNLKNSYGEVSLWHYPSDNFQPTGLQFCGLIMGDHSKSGINTMFNTGTVVGVFSNMGGGGFPPRFIPSFAWLVEGKGSVFQLEKALEVAPRVMERRQVDFSTKDAAILSSLFERTKDRRSLALST